jgi:hypothetical protein
LYVKNNKLNMEGGGESMQQFSFWPNEAYINDVFKGTPSEKRKLIRFASFRPYLSKIIALQVS